MIFAIFNLIKSRYYLKACAETLSDEIDNEKVKEEHLSKTMLKYHVRVVKYIK